MSVTCIIVNYRTPQLTVRALKALRRELDDVPGSRAIIVDNDSGDGSYECLSAALAAMGECGRVEVCQSGHNGGFGYGVNVGIRRALASATPPEAVYLLNSDAFPDPGCLRALLDFLRAHPRAGIAGSYIHGTDGVPHLTAFRFPSIPVELMGNVQLAILGRILRRWTLEPFPEHPQRVDWLAGASMLIRTDVLERIGLFDEGYFLYYEETDFCRRAADHGIETWYVPQSSVAHVGSASTGFQELSRPRPRYWFESRRRYFITHHGRAYLGLANVCWVVSFLLRRARWRLQRRPESDPPGLLRDFVRFSFR